MFIVNASCSKPRLVSSCFEFIGNDNIANLPDPVTGQRKIPLILIPLPHKIGSSPDFNDGHMIQRRHMKGGGSFHGFHDTGKKLTIFLTLIQRSGNGGYGDKIAPDNGVVKFPGQNSMIKLEKVWVNGINALSGQGPVFNKVKGQTGDLGGIGQGTGVNDKP